MKYYFPDDCTTPRKKRDFLIHYAKILLREANARRTLCSNQSFYWVLMEGASRARREAMNIDLRPAQKDLFG